MGRLWCSISRILSSEFRVLSFVVLLCLLWPSISVAQSGGDSGAFLRLGIGTRALSMGGAFTAVADDGAAVYWNPAGLGLGRRRLFNTMYRTMPFDRRQFVTSYTQGLAPGGGIGFAWIHVGADDIDGRDLNGQQTGTLSNSENALLFSFSPKIHPKVSVGISMKFLIHRLAGQSAKGFGGDIGVLVHPIDPLTVGFIFRDVGTRLSWDTTGLFPQSVQRRETFPRTLAFGAAYRLWQRRVLLAVDIDTAQRRDTEIRIGAEVGLKSGFALRTGMNDGQIAAGVGFITSLKSTQIRFHYVFLTDRVGLNETHAFEWEIGF